MITGISVRTLPATLLGLLAGCDPAARELAHRPISARIDREAVDAASMAADGSCDEPCSAGASCCTETFHHGSGAPIGWLRRGAPIAVPSADPDAIVLELKRWLAEHGAVAGLAAMADLTPLDGLSRWTTAPQVFRSLSTIRLHQHYRGVPTFGAGEMVTLTVSEPHGIIAVHGAFADARDTYAGWDAPIGPEAALAAGEELLAALHQESEEVDPLVYSLADPSLRAVVEIKAMAYVMRLLKNGAEVGTLVVRADTGAMLDLSFHAASALPDPAPVTVRGRTFQSDVYALSVAEKHLVADFSQLGGEPLLGSVYMPVACQEDPEASPQCGEARLGNLEVAIIDAQGQPIDDKESVLFVPTHPEGEFLAQPPATKDDPVTAETRAAALQDAFYRLLATVRLFAPFKAGHWDSMWLDDSGFGTDFVPRLAFFFDAPECPDGAPACANFYFPQEKIDGKVVNPTKYDEHPWTDLPPHQPPDGPDEAMGIIKMGTEGFRSIDMLFHEYGHVIDVFSAPHTIGHDVIGSGCKGQGFGEACQPACALDTTDESEPLAETVADLLGIFAIGRLYTGMTYESNCGAASAIASAGVSTPVHGPTCVADASQIRSFLDQRPTQPGYIPTDDGPIPTGKCNKSVGYRQPALLTAWWEWIHALHCATEAPFTCASFGEESFGASTGIEALLYALSLTNKTYYKEFFTAAETYLQCVHGDDLGARWREVWCHHGALECAQLPPPCPAICGDGVAQGDEDCDLQDMSGKTCESLGLGAGTLSCTPDCTLDTSACVPAGESTGEAPTTDTDATSQGGTSGEEPDSATSSVGGVASDDGCGCSATPAGGLWLLGLAPLLRRRRRARMDSRARAE